MITTEEFRNALPAGVGRPAIDAFIVAGFYSIDDLAKQKKADLAKLHGVGPKSLRIIEEELLKQGRSFAK